MLGFIKTLLRPDEEEDPAATVVARAANILQVGEFQFLQLAYMAWYGKELPEEACDRLFRSYMLDSEIPVWARHYANRVLRDDEDGVLDELNPAYHRYDHDYVTQVPDGLRRFTTVALFLVAVIAGGIFISSVTVEEGGSILPPYFADEDLPQSD